MFAYNRPGGLQLVIRLAIMQLKSTPFAIPFGVIEANCCKEFTAPFNNMRTLKFKGQPTNAFFATVNQMFGGSFELPTTVEWAVIKSHRWTHFSKQSRKLGGATEHLIDGSEKRICRLTFEFKSPHVIERRSKRRRRSQRGQRKKARILLDKSGEIIVLLVRQAFLYISWLTLQNNNVKSPNLMSLQQSIVYTLSLFQNRLYQDYHKVYREQDGRIASIFLRDISLP